MNNTILIIEDNEMNLEIASILLQAQQYHVLQAIDGLTGIELALEHCPRLILMDMHLPGKDGFEICQVLKSHPKTSSIIIIAFTALVMEEDKKKALSCGCSGVICKPIEVSSFVKTIESYLLNT